MKEILMPSKIERIGIIGIPSDWLIASVPDRSVLDRIKNYNFIEIPIEELYSLYEDILPTATGKSLETFEIKNQQIDSVELQKSEAFYLALKQIVDKYMLTALTIRCFDLLTEYQSTGCFALSKLNDEGIIAGCEGDIVSLIGMVFATRKTGQIVWMANPSQIDIDKSELVLAHCTVPTCLTNSVYLDTHFESDLGIGLSGEISESDVTLFRLGGEKLEKKFICTGQLIHHEYINNLCRTQVRVKADNKNKLTELLNNPLGNHLLIVQGKYPKILEGFLV